MAVTVTAADMLDGRADPAKAYLAKVTTFDPDTARPDNVLSARAEVNRRGKGDRGGPARALRASGGEPETEATMVAG